MVEEKSYSQETINMSTSSIEMLQEQYKIAVELYRHEDDLNWRKLHHLFYVTAGLWAVIGFIVKFNESLIISPRLLVGMVSLVGLIVSFAFGIALWFGVEYMLNRKNAVIAIEEILVHLGGRYIVSPSVESMKKKRFLKISPTTWMLRLLPILIFIVWMIMLFAIIFQKWGANFQ